MTKKPVMYALDYRANPNVNIRWAQAFNHAVDYTHPYDPHPMFPTWVNHKWASMRNRNAVQDFVDEFRAVCPELPSVYSLWLDLMNSGYSDTARKMVVSFPWLWQNRQECIDLVRAREQDEDFMVVTACGDYTPMEDPEPDPPTDPKVVYLCMEVDDQPEDENYPITDLQEFLEDHNEQLQTNYTTLEEFNDGEEFRTLIKIFLTNP